MDKDIPKGQRWFWVILVAAVCLLLAVGSESDAQETKSVGNLHFKIPEEWPVEKTGGLITPMPIEEYVTLRFREIEKEFLTVRNEFTEKLSQLETDLKSVEEDLSKEVKKIQSESEAQGGSSADLTDILSSIEMLKSELARLDRKITNKLKGIQAKFENMGAGTEVEFLKENMDGLQTQIYRLEEKVDYLEENQPSPY